MNDEELSLRDTVQSKEFPENLILCVLLICMRAFIRWDKNALTWGHRLDNWGKKIKKLKKKYHEFPNIGIYSQNMKFGFLLLFTGILC